MRERLSRETRWVFGTGVNNGDERCLAAKVNQEKLPLDDGLMVGRFQEVRRVRGWNVEKAETWKGAERRLGTGPL